MSTFVRRLFALLGLFYLSIPSLAGPLDDLDSCARRPEFAAGLTQLQKQCPELQQALRALGFAPWLSPEVTGKLNNRSLSDFGFLISRYELAQWHSGPGTASLPAIAAAINGVQPPLSLTWFDRLKVWVKNWIAEHHLSGADWINRWWARLVQASGFVTTVGYIAMALVVLAALTVIYIELKALGMWPRRGSVTAQAPQTSYPATPAAAQGSEGGNLGELFDRLVIFLARSGRLPRDSGLTHREVIAHSALDTPEQHRALAQIAASAELWRYGPPGARQQDFSPVVARAQGLLIQLSSLPASA